MGTLIIALKIAGLLRLQSIFIFISLFYRLAHIPSNLPHMHVRNLKNPKDTRYPKYQRPLYPKLLLKNGMYMRKN